MELIVDVQGFCIPDFVVKELAILSRDGKNFCHFIFKPPIPYNLLDRKAKSNVCWLQYNHHGMSWEDGFVKYEELGHIKDLFNSASLIYVKGNEKKKFVEKFYQGNVVNLEEKPSMKKFNHEKRCFAHAPPFVCSIHNVYVIKLMLDSDHVQQST